MKHKRTIDHQASTIEILSEHVSESYTKNARQIDLVREYYRQVDKGDFNWVEKMFSHDAIYHRGDCLLNGAIEIGDFYRSKRQLSGTHELYDICHNDDLVVVRGSFSGTGLGGAKRLLPFSDWWYFDNMMLVKRRETYLLFGSEYTL